MVVPILGQRNPGRRVNLRIIKDILSSVLVVLNLRLTRLKEKFQMSVGNMDLELRI